MEEVINEVVDGANTRVIKATKDFGIAQIDTPEE